ncbi:MAG: hypothetical protein P8X82_07460 [Gemmatimonadales bacterium]
MKLSSWAEAIGLVAVVVSLVFVGMEVRQSTQASRAANQHSLLELGMTNGNMIAADEELSHIFEAMLAGEQAALTELQRARGSRLVGNAFNLWEAAYYNYQTDQLNDELWQGWNSYHASSLSRSGAKAWWRKHRRGYGKSFARHVDEAFERAKEVEP